MSVYVLRRRVVLHDLLLFVEVGILLTVHADLRPIPSERRVIVEVAGGVQDRGPSQAVRRRSGLLEDLVLKFT